MLTANSSQVRLGWSGRKKKNRSISMATIVHYRERKAAVNGYPERIVSPFYPSECCSMSMEQVGEVEEDGNWLYIYKGCPACGYTVRHFLMMSPQALQNMRGEILKVMNKVSLCGG